MPIGSFLLWRTKEHDLRCYDKLGPLRFAWSSRDEPEKNGSIRQYLLDGHQRLTTLYVSLGEGLTAGEQDLPVSDPEELPDENWPIFFDLEERAFRVNKKKAEPPSTWLPLSILLDPYKLFEFQKRLLEGKADRALVNRAESLASTFKDYTIPVVPIVTEDLEIATQSFQRLNNGGTPMTEVHMVSALTWSPEFDLNERIQEVLTELGEVGWQDLEEKMILNTCKASLDLDIYYADTEEIRKAIKDRPQVLDAAKTSLKSAALFLRERCKIYGPAILPYSFQVVLLADALEKGTDGFQKELNPAIATALTRWFWLTTYTEHFAGISAPRLARTMAHLRSVASKGEDPTPPGISREVRTLHRFDFRTARSRAISIRLAEVAESSGSSEGYSPFQLLADLGRDAMPMLIPSRDLPSRMADGPENRVLAHPRELSQLRRTLKDPERLTNHFLQRHALYGEAVSYLAEGYPEEFIQLRREILMELEDSFVSSLGLFFLGD
jgi:hypothetical protein